MNLSRKLKQFEERPGLLIVLSGPSGVGKDTLLGRLTDVCPGLKRAVTYTTRPPRSGETSGVDYNFVTIEEFRCMAEAGHFLEYAEVHGNLYGSSLRDVQEIRAGGNDVVLKIDVQGGGQRKDAGSSDDIRRATFPRGAGTTLARAIHRCRDGHHETASGCSERDRAGAKVSLPSCERRGRIRGREASSDYSGGAHEDHP